MTSDDEYWILLDVKARQVAFLIMSKLDQAAKFASHHERILFN